MDDESIFKALADPTRRRLLDRLFERDGQTLLDLTAGLGMTRQGVMKHLDILVGVGLVTAHRTGREKHHYLNPVPVRQIHDRWISKFAESWTRRLIDLKTTLEVQSMESIEIRPRHVHIVYIRTTPEQLWEAFTNPEFTRQYYYGTAVNSDWRP